MTYQRIKPVVPAIAPPGGCERLSCCIPFCRRTFRNDKKLTPWPEGMETMCGKHWRLGSVVFRRRHSRLMRLYKRGPSDAIRFQIFIMLERLWDRIKKQATERAGGIA